MSSPGSRSAVGILSIGDMGVGIAKLLVAHGLTVVTNCKGRSEDTAQRAREAGVKLLNSDEDLVARSAVILSVVPPRDAAATAERIIDALPPPSSDPASSTAAPLIFVDLNAVSPASVKGIAALFTHSNSRPGTQPITFVDGCILGGPPQPNTSSDPGTNMTASPSGTSTAKDWSIPGFPTSGPTALFDDGPSADTIPARLASIMGISPTTHLSSEIGGASGLKMCFGSFTKGFTALAAESFTTAHQLGVLPSLRQELSSRLPAYSAIAERAVTAMPPKAYRWVREMEEISDTHRDEGGFQGEEMFKGAAEVYRTVTEDTVLGSEKIGKRQRGTDVGDFAAAMGEGMEKKRKKTE